MTSARNCAWLVGGALLALAATASAQEDESAEPSFDCAAATAPVEALICSDSGLADLDRTLAESYQALLATRVGEAQSCCARSSASGRKAAPRLARSKAIRSR